MRKSIVNSWKRAGALALATAMLAGALALPASAAADAAYIQPLEELSEKRWDDPDAYQRGLQQLMQQYPNSPELCYRYSETLWEDTGRSMDQATFDKVRPYLDKTIALALQDDCLYQDRYENQKRDYATMAAWSIVYFLSTMPGHQEELNDAMQQYLDCYDRGTRIHLRDIDQEKAEYVQAYLEGGETAAKAEQYATETIETIKENYQEILNEEIPANRRELEKIRAWTGTGVTSFTQQYRYSEEPVQITIAANRKSVVEGNRVWYTSKSIQSIQRTLEEVIVFVPNGTVVQSESGSYRYEVTKEEGIGFNEILFVVG